MSDPNMLPMSKAANYVLHMREPGMWIGPGGFYEQLIEAAFHADGENLHRISLGFPTVAVAVAIYKHRGPSHLIRLAGGRDSLFHELIAGAQRLQLPLAFYAGVLSSANVDKIEWVADDEIADS